MPRRTRTARPPRDRDQASVWLVLSVLISIGPALVAYVQGRPLLAAVLLAPFLISFIAAGLAASWIVRRCLPVSDAVPSVTLVVQLSQMLGDTSQLTVRLLDTEAPFVVLLGSSSRPSLFVSRALLERLDHDERRALFGRLSSGLAAREPARRARAVVLSGGPALVGRALVPGLAPFWSLLATLGLPWAAAWQRGLLGWRRLTRADDRAALGGIDASALASALEVLRDDSGEVAGIDALLAGLPVVPVRSTPDRERLFGRLTTDLRASRLQAHAGYRRHERQTDSLVSLRPDDSPEWEVVDGIEGAIDLTRPGWTAEHDPPPVPDDDFSHLEALIAADQEGAAPSGTPKSPLESVSTALSQAQEMPPQDGPLDDPFAADPLANDDDSFATPTLPRPDTTASEPVDDPFAPPLGTLGDEIEEFAPPVGQEAAAEDPFAPTAPSDAEASVVPRRRWRFWSRRRSNPTAGAAVVGPPRATQDVSAAIVDMISEGGPVDQPNDDPSQAAVPNAAEDRASEEREASEADDQEVRIDPAEAAAVEGLIDAAAPVFDPQQGVEGAPRVAEDGPDGQGQTVPLALPDDTPRRRRRSRRRSGRSRFRWGRSGGRRPVPDPDVPYALDVDLLPALEPLFPSPPPAPSADQMGQPDLIDIVAAEAETGHAPTPGDDDHSVAVIEPLDGDIDPFAPAGIDQPPIVSDVTDPWAPIDDEPDSDDPQDEPGDGHLDPAALAALMLPMDTRRPG